LRKNIVIIGFMGTGKTTVGRRLARRLKRKFIDTDLEIEKITGKSITQIFARDGATRFRSEEALLVKKLALREGLVISTGGGLVLNPENIRLLQENGIIVALTASPEVIYDRVRRNKNRPLLFNIDNTDLKEKIRELLVERKGAYDVAELSVDTGACSIDGTVAQIIHYLLERNQI
jgi:shikimate kinase